MAFLGFGKKKKVLDLTANYKRQMERAEQARKEKKDSPVSTGNGPFSFFDSPQVASSPSSFDSSDDSETETSAEKRKKLAKRIMDMTEKIEDLSNQIYRLQQRLEVLERKLDIRNN